MNIHKSDACSFQERVERLTNEVDEDVEMDAEEVSFARLRHGMVGVTITRGKDEKRIDSKRRNSPGKATESTSPNTAASSKAVVSDNRVSHALK